VINFGIAEGTRSSSSGCQYQGGLSAPATSSGVMGPSLASLGSPATGVEHAAPPPPSDQGNNISSSTLNYVGNLSQDARDSKQRRHLMPKMDFPKFDLSDVRI
jgi:hypothetical protein